MDIPMARFAPPLNPNLMPLGGGGQGSPSMINNLELNQQQQPVPQQQPHQLLPTPVGPPKVNQIWIETKAADGKVYYYDSVTRETSWNKPEGKTIMTLEQFGAHMQAQQQMQGPGLAPGLRPGLGGGPPPGLLGNRPPGMMAGGGMPPVGHPGFNPNFGGRFPPQMAMSSHQQHHPSLLQNPNQQQQRPPWAGVPHQQVQQPNSTSSAPPLLGNVPSNNHQLMAMNPTSMANNPILGQHQQPSNMFKPNVPMMPQPNVLILDPFIDPEIKKRAAEWIEYKTPEGKSYFFNTNNKQSVWDKPKPLLDMDMAIEKAKDLLAAKNVSSAAAGDMKTMMMAMATSQEVSQEVITLDSTSTNGHGNGPTSKLIESKVAEQQQLPKDKSKPVSSTPVDKTPWCVVWTGDGKVFFYNPSTKTSVWERPADLIGRVDVDKLLKGPPEEKPEVVNEPIVATSKVVEPLEVSKRPSESEPEPLSKKLKKLEEEKQKKESEAEMTPEMAAAKKREEVPLEERIKEFKLLLSEKKVSAFSTWEKELHKIVFDPRYLLLTSKERKDAFNDYVSEIAEEEREEKRRAYKTARDDYRKMLEEANLSVKSVFADFCRKFSKDDRFLIIEKMREKEGLFNDYINDLKRKEREEKINFKERVIKDFNQLLKDKETELIKFTKKFKWSDVREVLKNDVRYRNMDCSSSEKEDIVRDFVSMLRKQLIDDPNEDKEEGEAEEETSEDEEEKVSKEKEQRIEASIKNRKQEVEKEMSTHLKERQKERQQHLKLESIEVMNELMADLIKNPDMSFKDGRKVLFKDKRIERCSEHLSRDEIEVLYQQHLEQLVKKKVDRFNQLMDEHKIGLTDNWRDVRRMVKDDPRFVKFSSSDRKCERQFKEYQRCQLEKSKQELKEFLSECKILTYKSGKLIEESDAHLQEIISVLQNDQRYLNLEPFEDERREILMNYVEELEKKGPPPPPTASEPIRKKVHHDS